MDFEAQYFVEVGPFLPKENGNSSFLMSQMLRFSSQQVVSDQKTKGGHVTLGTMVQPLSNASSSQKNVAPWSFFMADFRCCFSSIWWTILT